MYCSKCLFLVRGILKNQQNSSVVNYKCWEMKKCHLESSCVLIKTNWVPAQTDFSSHQNCDSHLELRCAKRWIGPSGMILWNLRASSSHSNELLEAIAGTLWRALASLSYCLWLGLNDTKWQRIKWQSVWVSRHRQQPKFTEINTHRNKIARDICTEKNKWKVM